MPYQDSEYAPASELGCHRQRQVARAFPEGVTGKPRWPRAPGAIVRRPALFTVAIVGAVLAGCQVTDRASNQMTVPREGSAELVRYISDEPFVTAEPAYRAIHALAHGEAFTGDFGALAEKLRAEGLIGKDWGHAANRYLDRGTIAYMVCRACQIRSGLNWLLTGLGRYAWRELQYKGIAGDGSEFGRMSGGEFVGLLLRAEDYLQRTGKRDVQRTELGPRR